MKKILFLLLLSCIGFLAIPMSYYIISDLISIWNRIHVKDEFYIEYLEMYASVSLWIRSLLE